MKLSTRSRYGTRILVELACRQEQGPVQVSEISSSQKISVKYLEQLIRTLKEAELITSVRGPKGGHLLTKKPEDITLGQIVRLFEGQTDLVECISYPEKCPMSVECQVRLAWQSATQALFDSLDTTTIADLLSSAEFPDGDNQPCPASEKTALRDKR